MPTILPAQRTLSWSLFFFSQTDNGEGVEGGGGVKCVRVETMFNQEFTPIGPRPNLILFNPLHCYKKFIHAAGDHHWSRRIIRLVRTAVKAINFSQSPRPLLGTYYVEFQPKVIFQTLGVERSAQSLLIFPPKSPSQSTPLPTLHYHNSKVSKDISEVL